MKAQARIGSLGREREKKKEVVLGTKATPQKLWLGGVFFSAGAMLDLLVVGCT